MYLLIGYTVLIIILLSLTGIARLFELHKKKPKHNGPKLFPAKEVRPRLQAAANASALANIVRTRSQLVNHFSRTDIAYDNFKDYCIDNVSVDYLTAELDELGYEVKIMNHGYRIYREVRIKE